MTEVSKHLLWYSREKKKSLETNSRNSLGISRPCWGWASQVSSAAMSPVPVWEERLGLAAVYMPWQLCTYPCARINRAQLSSLKCSLSEWLSLSLSRGESFLQHPHDCHRYNCLPSGLNDVCMHCRKLLIPGEKNKNRFNLFCKTEDISAAHSLVRQNIINRPGIPVLPSSAHQYAV